MLTKFSTTEGAWVFLCLYGCRGAGYDTEREAVEAELEHDCWSSR